jgi:gas vesicle protein
MEGIEMRKFGIFVIGAAMGGLLASSLALLLAPTSGPKLRSQIQGFTRQLTEDMKTATQQRREQLVDELIRLRTTRPTIQQ